MVQGVLYNDDLGNVSITQDYEPLVYVGKTIITSWATNNFSRTDVAHAQNGVISDTADGSSALFPIENRAPLFDADEHATIFWNLLLETQAAGFGRDEVLLNPDNSIQACRFVRWTGGDPTIALANRPDMDAWFFRSARPRPENELTGSQGLRILNTSGDAVFDSRERYPRYVQLELGRNLVTGRFGSGALIALPNTGTAVYIWETPLEDEARAILDDPSPSAKLGVTMPTITAAWFSEVIWWVDVHIRTQQDIDFGDPGAVGDYFLRVVYHRGPVSAGIFDLPELNAAGLENINISIIDASDLP